jgi:Ni,Fe-hydrogenase I large subunit
MPGCTATAAASAARRNAPAHRRVCRQGPTPTPGARRRATTVVVVETGALARQMVAGQPLLRALVAADGGSVLARVVARLLELALVVPAMERWVRALTPGEAFCSPWQLPDQASAVGLVEAARGALGHWLRIERGKIAGYQIIAPTTWNFSPRDAAGVPGALEQALVGLPVGEGESVPLAVQHVVRSFDPCMVCTVH